MIRKNIPYNILMAVGLLSLCGVNAINMFVHVPDFIRGFFVGLGFIFVLTAFIRFVRQRRKPTV